jgi:two-component system, cell cycle response regulator
MTARRARTEEIVPLDERIRSMRWLRLILGVVVVAYALFGAGTTAVPALLVITVTGVFLAALLGAEALWRRLGGRGITLFGSMLIADGLYLAWAAAVTGGTHSTVRYLLVLHLVAVTLLASYRTGLRLAMWHSMIPLVHHHLQSDGLLSVSHGGEDLGALTGFIAALWVVAMGTATFSAMNERELRRRRYDLEALAALATQLEEADDEASVAQTLADSLADSFTFPRVAILGARGPGATVLATHGLDAGTSDIPAFEERSVVLHAVAAKHPMLVTHLDAQADPALRALIPDGRNLLVAPLLAEGGFLGAVVAEHDLRQGTRVERRVVATVERFTAHAALALRNARLLDKVRTLATIDHLTGVANRRSFETALEAELARTRRTGEPTALIMCDIDRFKLLNDEHGHQVGDEVLQGVAALLQAGAREYDTVGRFGGEEFTVVMPGCDVRDAAMTAERLRSAIEAATLAVPVTVSFGVAVAPHQAATVDGLVKAADDALYRAKAEGRNRVSVSQPLRANLAVPLSGSGA